MNMQAMLKQAQKMQSEMLKEKSQIDGKIFEGKSSLVTVQVYGTKKIESISIMEDALDDAEMLQDMLVIAINDAMDQIDKETDEKLGKYTKGLNGIL